MSKHAPLRIATFLVLACAACSPSVVRPQWAETSHVDQATPLGPGYVLLPLGTDDDAMLGQVVESAPSPGQALEELSRPNPCADKLAPPASVGMVSTVEDAQELKLSAQGRAVLGVYGFQAAASRATHLVYKLATERKASRAAPPEYVACCREKGCGYGTVTELVYGDGDLSAAEETAGEASAEIVTIAGAKGTASLKILHKRHVHGWIAAKVMLQPAAPSAPAPPPVLSAVGPSAVVLDVDSASAQVKEIYDREKVSLCPQDDSWAFCDGRDKLNEFVLAERYRDVLHTEELADLETRRNTGWLALEIGAMVGGLGLTTYAFVDGANMPRDLPDSERSAGSTRMAVLASVGGAVMIAGLIPFIMPEWGVGLVERPSVTDHKLTRADAERVAERYNRALLRKVTTEVEGSRWDTRPRATRVRFVPRIGLGGVGLGATF